MRFGCLGLFLGLALTWGGGQSLYTALASGDQKTVTYAQLIHDQSTSGWYKLSDASWTLADAVVITGALGVSSDIYVPVRPIKGEDTKFRLLVHVVDEELAREVSAIVDLPEAEQIKRVTEFEKLYLTKHPVEGLLEFGIESDSKQTEAVSNALGEDLATDYRVIQLGAKPGSPWLGIVMTLVGILILLGSGAAMLRGGESKAEPA